MSEKIIPNECVVNVENVTISDNTRKLLACYTQLLDLGQNIRSVLISTYDSLTADKILEPYFDTNAYLASELMKVISGEINNNLVETNFKEL